MTDLNIDAAVEEAADALCDSQYPMGSDANAREFADIALTAALPYVRAALADEIEANYVVGDKPLNQTYNDGMEYAASIVRGEDA